MTEYLESKGKWRDGRIRQSIEEIANARALIGVTSRRRGSGVDDRAITDSHPVACHDSPTR